MTTILSSRWSIVHKWTMPAVVLLLAGLTLLFPLRSLFGGRFPSLIETLLPVALFAILCFQIRRRFTTIVDFISYDAGTVRVKIGNKEDMFSLRVIDRIDDNTFARPETITLFLLSASKFGEKIVFYPHWSWNPFETHPVAATLAAILEQEKAPTMSSSEPLHSGTSDAGASPASGVPSLRGR